MRLISLLVLIFWSLSALAADRTLNQKITHYQEFNRLVGKHCVNNIDSNNVVVPLGNQTLSCPQLLSLSYRLHSEIDAEVRRLEECAENNVSPQANQLANQTMAIARKAIACPATPSDAVCLGQFTCAALTTTNPLLALASNIGVGPSCGRNALGDVGNCLKSVLKGIYDSLWGLISLVWDVGKAAVRKLGEWTGLVKRAERASSAKLMAAQQSGPGFISRFISNPGKTMREMAASMYNGIKKAAMESYGCEQWTGAPFVSRCVRPMTNWKCASCTQKMQMMCGIAGFAVGEIATSLLTGGIFAAGKVGLSALKGVAVAARSNKVSRMAVTAIRAVPKGDAAIAVAARAARVTAQGTGRILTATEKGAIRLWDGLSNNRVTNAVVAAGERFSKTRAGRITSGALRPVGIYLDALEKAAELGFKSTDNLLTTGSIRGAGAARVAAGADAVVDATRADAVVDASRADAVVPPSRVPGDEADISIVPPTTPIDEVASTPISSSTRLDDSAELADDLDTPIAPSTVARTETPRPSALDPNRNRSSSLTVESSPTPTPVAVTRTDTPRPSALDPNRDQPRLTIESPTSVTRTETPRPSSLTLESAPTPIAPVARVERVAPDASTLRTSNVVDTPRPTVSVPTTVRRPAAEVTDLSAETASRLRASGIDPDKIVTPYPAKGKTAKEFEVAEAQRAREIEFTRVDLENRFTQWREAGVYDDIFNTLGKIGSEQEKKRYLAILLNAPKKEVAATLQRLQRFRNLGDKSDYFKALDTRVSGLADDIQATSALPGSIERTNKLAELTRQRSALLQERTLLSAGDDLEIVNLFSARASNQNYLDKKYSPHSLDDSFSVDLKVKKNTEVCRGSYAGAGGAASNLVGGFLTFCREKGYNDRQQLQTHLAAPGDRLREGKATFGYERFNKFDLKRDDRITLGLNGPVTYTDEGMLGTGGIGGGIELFTYRSPKNPISLDRFSGSTRIPSCSRADCDKIFNIQERLRGSNLANQSDASRYLDQTARETNGIIKGLEPRIDEYVESIARGGDPNLTRLKEEFSEVRTAFSLQREIELKRGIRPGALDRESVAFRNNISAAERLGDDVAAKIKADGITDINEIQRRYREAIENSPLARSHSDNIRFIEDATEKIKSGKLTAQEKRDLVYQLTVRAGQEEDLALAFKTLDYKVGKSTENIASITEDQRKALATFTQNNVRDMQRNGLARAPALDARITPELRRVAGLNDRQRLREASKVLGNKPLTGPMSDAILEAHSVGRGSGRGFYTYTQEDILKKGRILRGAGFSQAEVRTIMEKGIAGSPGSKNILDNLFDEAAAMRFDVTPPTPVRTSAVEVAPETTRLNLNPTPVAPTPVAPTTNWDNIAADLRAQQQRTEAADMWGRVAKEYETPVPAVTRAEVPPTSTPVPTPRVDPVPQPRTQLRVESNPTPTPSPRVQPQSEVRRVTSETPTPAVREATPVVPERVPAARVEPQGGFTPLSKDEVRAGGPLNLDPNDWNPRYIQPTPRVQPDLNRIGLELTEKYKKLDDTKLFYRANDLQRERLAARQKVIDEFDNTQWRTRYNQMRADVDADKAWYLDRDYALERARITRVPEADKLKYMDETMRGKLDDIDAVFAKENAIIKAEQDSRRVARTEANANRAPLTDEQLRTQTLERENWVVRPEERDIFSSRRNMSGEINTRGIANETQLRETAQLQIARSSGVLENKAQYISYKPKYAPRDAENAFNKLFVGQQRPPNIRRAHSVLTMEPQTATRVLSENMPDVEALYNRLKNAKPGELEGISPQMKKYYEDRLEIYVCYQKPAACRNAPPVTSNPRITPELQRIGALNDTDRLVEANRVTGRTLNPSQQAAVIEAHNVGAGTGRGFFTYTKDEIAKKGLILKRAGFSKTEIRDLMEKGVTGSVPQRTSLLDAAIENTDFAALMRQPVRPAPAVRNLAQLEDAAEASARQYDNLRATSRDPAAIYEAKLKRDQDALTASYAREDANRVTAAAQAEQDAKLFQEVLNRPVAARTPSSTSVVTERAPNPVREQMSPEKLAQIEAAYEGNQLDVILNMPSPGARVAYKGSGDTVRDATLVGVDPAKPSNFLVVTTDTNGVESRISLAQTAVASTPAEIRILSATPEVQAANRRVFEEVLANAGKRTPARQPTAAEIKAAEDKRIQEMVVQIATGNPKQKEIDALSRELQGISILDPDYQKTMDRIREMERPYSPVLDPQEAKAFAIIAEIPEDVVKFSPQEWKAIQEANRIRKTRVATVDTPEFRRAFALADDQETRLTGIISRMDSQYEKAYPRKFGQTTAEIPTSVVTELQSIPKAKELLASAQKLFKVRPSGAGVEELSSDYFRVRGFFFGPANKELVESSEALKYVQERFRRYQKAMDAKQELGSRTPGIP